MNRRKPAVAVLFIVFAPSAMAQAQMPNNASGASESHSETVVNAPFSADITQVSEMVMPNGEHKRQESRGRECRDSQGRFYLDLGFRSSGEPAMPPILITDPVAHMFIALDPVRKEAEISDWPSHPPTLQIKSNGTPPPPNPRQPRIAKVEDVGTQVIQGSTVRGTRTTYSRSPENEAVSPDNSYSITNWVSDELKIVVLNELKQGNGGLQRKAVNIVRAEPDESLFQIPPGYKLFDRRQKSGVDEEHEKKAAETNLSQSLMWTDSSTGLTWTKQDNGIGIDWNQAKQYCSDMRVGGFSDWRLPTIDELSVIFDPTQNVSGYHIKGGIRLSLCCTWSSSTRDSRQAWILHFIGGGRVSGRFDFTFRVLCVRSPEMRR